MRILIAHNAYQQRGGEDVVFEQESAMLAAAGLDVRRFTVCNDHIQGLMASISAARSVISNKAAVTALCSEVADFVPDVVHIHNFFPTLSPTAIDAVARRGIPLVLTLHNYRLICPGSLLMRDGRPCEDCVGRTKLPGIHHACYRRSSIGTAMVGAMGMYFKGLLKKHLRALTLIALTEFAKSRFIADGFPADSIIVRGNVISDPGAGSSQRERRIVYVGRLSSEKGVDTLLRAAHNLDGVVEIIGDGPERAQLERIAPRNVVFSGQLAQPQVLERLKSAAALAVPSRWYEGFPMVLLEAMATGTPILASRLGSLVELVAHEQTGYLLGPADATAWRDAMRGLFRDPALARTLGGQARSVFLDRHSAKTGLSTLMRVYQAAMQKISIGSNTRVEGRRADFIPADFTDL